MDCGKSYELRRFPPQSELKELDYHPGPREHGLGLEQHQHLGLHDVLQQIAQVRQVVRVEEHVVAAALEGILFDDGSEVLLHESGFGAALELVVAEEASEGLDDCRRANVRVKRPGSEFRFRIYG